MTEVEKLCETAIQMREYAYVPYSGFRVGAALLCADGSIYTGCNIENASYSPTNCAERTAFFKAVSEGKRAFTAIAIAGGPSGKIVDYCAPCGVCRQVMREFCEDSFQIILARTPSDYRIYTLKQMLPAAFGPESLQEDGIIC